MNKKIGFIGFGKMANAIAGGIIDSNFCPPSDIYIFDVNKEIQINVKDSIIIGNHVWLGNKCTVLSGAKIGDGSIVASNGVVTKKFPNNCIVAGVPSKIIRKDIAWDRSITNATLVKDSLYWKRTEFMT